MTCPGCKVWEVLESDNYCSWCGHKFISLDVRIQPNRFSHDDTGAAWLTIQNSGGKNPVILQQITPSIPWLTVDLGSTRLPLSLEPGRSQRFRVEVDPLDLEEQYATGLVIVQSSAGTERASVEIVPPPEVRIHTKEYEIFLDNRDLEQTFAQIEVLQGVVTLLGISAEPSEWVRVKTVEEVHFPVTLDARSKNVLEVRLIVDEEHLARRSTAYPAKYDGLLKLAGTDFEWCEPFRIVCWRPPELWAWEESEPIVKAYAGQRGELTLSMQNKRPGDPLAGQGNATLEIRSIAVLDPDGKQNPWLKPAEPLTSALRIEGGAMRQFRFRFLTDGCEEDGATAVPIGRHFVRLVLETNLPEPLREIRFEVRVEEMSVYDGILALDFGTSNTCCAVLGRHEDRFVLLPIDPHSNRPTTTPTVIQYRDLQANGKPTVEIGALVEARYPEPRVVAASVRSPKRFLGRNAEDDKFEVRFYDKPEKEARLSAREVTADYLSRVRMVAEQHGKALFRRIIITHPARFRMNQLRDLQEAVREAFGATCEITPLQEPVAAALEFIVSAEALENERYTLGVFDFGGGTTDLSLLHVENIRQGAFTEIRVRLVSSTGKWFGGENLTDFVFQHGLGCSRKLAEEARKQAEIFTDPKQIPDPSKGPMARGNRAALLKWAEATKLLLVGQGDQHEPEIKLNVFTPAGVEELKLQHDWITPSQEDLLRYLEGQVLILADLLAGLLKQSGYSKIDFLALSGKSSAIPTVREVLSRRFPDCSLRMAEEPKECVVSGACILEKFQDSPDMCIDIIDLTTTTSRIGIESIAVGGARVFQQWFAAGVPIPTEGLCERRPYLVRLNEIVLIENDGEQDALWIMGKKNPDISELGTYVLESPPEWLQPRRKYPGSVELKVSRNFEFSLTAWADGHEVPLRFVCRKSSG